MKIYANKVYEFLSELATLAASKGLGTQLERIDFARKHYIFPLTSEFLGVSMVVLQEILRNSPGLLSEEQHARASEYVAEIKKQFFS